MKKEIKINKLVTHRKNPRFISGEDMSRLKQSLKDNPELFQARPIIVSNRTGENIIIAGNQRYHAAKENGLTSVPVFIMENLSEEKEAEIMMRDNVSNGDWDWDIIRDDWGDYALDDWGVELPTWDSGEEEEEIESGEIELDGNSKINLTFSFDIDKANDIRGRLESIDKDLNAALEKLVYERT